MYAAFDEKLSALLLSSASKYSIFTQSEGNYFLVTSISILYSNIDRSKKAMDGWLYNSKGH